ncbi:MAG: hypothetical protein H6Q68_145 [Firmicutes bacterium]|nr:hypothetical protein [Bacillota bacterium]
MSISAVSNQSGQSSQSDTTSLEASKQKILTEIKKLQKEDAVKNAKEIQSLEQQAQLIEMQLAQQKAQSQTATTSANASAEQNVGPAYSVQLENQNVEASNKSLSEESSTSSETSQTIDLSI